MTKILSICIPTLNRSVYLCKALNSIFQSTFDTSRVEICISDNASDENYDAALQLLETGPAGLTIRHVVQPSRLPVDEHMMAVKNLATCPYIYFLGDDDLFLDGQLSTLLSFIDQESPDLAIFNGRLIDDKGRFIGTHFNIPARRYSTIEDAFTDLRDKSMFGAVLVKRNHLDDKYFRVLFGTSHAYACYWLSLMNKHLNSCMPTIFIPDFPLVGLRMAAKTYNQLDVYYRDIPYEISVYKRYLPPGFAQQLNEEFNQRFLRKISSLRFLLALSNTDSNISRIWEIDPRFYKRYRLKIAISKFIVRTGGLGFLRGILRSLIRRT